MSFVKVRGIVINSININDSDKIITLISDKLGKIDVVANGCRKPKSRFMASTQLFCYGEYMLTTGKNLHILKESNIIESFQGLILDLDTLAYGSYFLEFIYNLLEKDQRSVNLMALLLKTLYIMLKGKTSLPLLKVTFDMKAISLAGYMPEVFKCVACLNTNDEFVFSTLNGGILCSKCKGNGDIPLNSDELNFLKTIRNIRLEELENLQFNQTSLEKVQSILGVYIRNYVEKDFNSLQLLKKI